MFDWFQKILGKNPKDTDVEQQSLKEYKDMFNPNNIKDSIVEFKDNHVGDKNYYFNISITPESVDRIEETAIVEKVRDIEKLIEKHKYITAIGMYKDLLEDYALKSLSANDSFYIFNGILNCYVNINDKANTEKYITKIKALGNVNEIHKFHFICAVYYINQRESNKALEEINKAVAFKSDYFKAICLKILIEFENNIIDAETAKRQLVDDNDKPITGNGENKENACIFNILGDIYLLSREYEKAIKYYSKANELIPSPFEKMHIGLAVFFDAVKDAKVGEVIDSKDVDFKKLREANSILDELYNYDDEEIRNVIRKHISSFYMKCLYILRDTTRINMIFNEVKDYCLNEKEEIYRLKAISEAIAGDITDGTFRELGEEDKAWIQIFKMMEEKKYDRVISEVEPFIWAKYKDIEKYHYTLLEAYLHQSTDESYSKFEKHYKQLVDLGKKLDYIMFLKGQYYEFKGNIAKAEFIIKEVAINTSDFHLYFELITFYERYKLEKELGELFNELIDNNHKIIEAEKNIFYRKYFLYLFRNNMLKKAVEVYSALDREGINDITYSFITAELYYLVGDLKKSDL